MKLRLIERELQITAMWHLVGPLGVAAGAPDLQQYVAQPTAIAQVQFALVQPNFGPLQAALAQSLQQVAVSLLLPPCCKTLQFQNQGLLVVWGANGQCLLPQMQGAV